MNFPMERFLTVIVMAQVASTLTIVGLIWFVQVVHYPLMARVGIHDFPAYEEEHQRLTTWVVGPLMLVELLTAGWLLLIRPEEIQFWIVLTGSLLLVLIWCMTFFIQVPQHVKLSSGYQPDVLRYLVTTNWWRTVLWTTRGFLVLGIIWQLLD
jgi:hypothetical protein